ncbi:Increased DNA methylation 1 [Quillaja saponaria]|uniref:Increased DNA methylation 1 n=1 Tax=Quillaja saponaria TaxID=32244 RepID=A0AAD7PJT5_QUISA|nr:Increased DNA methylation 1 [Quillaja saponaria]
MPIPLGEDNLTWTLLKTMNSKKCETDTSDLELRMQINSKLNLALSVMQECFEPSIEALTGKDLVGKVIFSRRSKLTRLNYKGFYTVILEKNEEVVSVATVRIYGDKAAEVPLVATRFHFGWMRMCRVLMNALEQELKELGVERMTLPAVPGVLNTWINAFGFRRMNLKDCNLLTTIFWISKIQYCARNSFSRILQQNQQANSCIVQGK